MHLLATARVAVTECSLNTKLVCLSLCVLYLCSFSYYGMRYLPVTPGFLFPPNLWVWTLVTSPFFNFHIPFLLTDIATVFLVEKLLLPLWGWRETVKFCVLIQASTVILCAVYCYMCYLISVNLFFLYQVSICGLLPILGGLSVACRQMMPDNILVSLPLGKFRNKHLPFFLCVVLSCFSLYYYIGLHVFLVMFGIFSSWIYLRFYQRHANGMKGDSSDDFTFARFFPNHLEPPIAVLSNGIFALLLRLKLCKPIDRQFNFDSPANITLTIKTSGDPGDLERRKLIALRALNMRLSEMDTVSSWPAIEQEDPQGSGPPKGIIGGQTPQVAPLPSTEVISASGAEITASPPPLLESVVSSSVPPVESSSSATENSSPS